MNGRDQTVSDVDRSHVRLEAAGLVEHRRDDLTDEEEES